MQVLVDEPVESGMVEGDLDPAGVRDHRGEAELVPVDDLAKVGVSRDDHGAVAGLAGVHHRARARVADDGIRCSHQVDQHRVGHELVADSHRRRDGVTVLDDHLCLGMPLGDGIEPVHDAVELVVVGAEGGDDRAWS